ncbi:HTH-10 family transcription regulator [Halobacterium hubeiense]|uniref:HTH-10 family transcription regulator n=2 Tax=Halobacterium TaxID=2239 RepID=A0A0U5GZ79_9EURY|nr:helix-turn-helix domain-containing protein [Halobacterium hubeiense]CQH53221.1 HTH-10 family transcription regulator [Halobacterium hubeiense]
MGVIAEFTFRHPGLPLMSSLEESDVRLDVEQAVAADPDEPVLFVWASDGDLDEFEAALGRDETVAEYTLVEDAGDHRLYRVAVSEQTPVSLYPVDDRMEASRLDVTSSADGVDARLRFPDRESLSEFRPRVEARGVDATLRGVYSDTESALGDEYGLSAKQREALVTAAELGYYDVPRQASLSDVADDLDVSPQAASERLRRGVKTFVREALD